MDEFNALLTDLHHSIDRLAENLSGDRPQLVAALRCSAAWIPRPDELARAAAPREPVPPLLYRALDAGVVDARRFDVLMLRAGAAERRLRDRATGKGR